MSEDDHGPTHPNGVGGDADLAVGNHTRPQEASAIAPVNTDAPVSVPPHPEDRAFEYGVANDASVTPAVQPIPQAVLLQAGTKLELGHEDAAGTIGDGQHSEGDGTDEEKVDEGDDDEDGNEDGEEEEEDEGEEEEDEDEEEEDEDEEPALKYERFGGAFQDLLKKDSASALAVSSKFLVRDVILAQWSRLYRPAGSRFAQRICTYPRLDGQAYQDI
jgi:hypothetical protein